VNAQISRRLNYYEEASFRDVEFRFETSDCFARWNVQKNRFLHRSFDHFIFISQSISLSAICSQSEKNSTNRFSHRFSHRLLNFFSLISNSSISHSLYKSAFIFASRQMTFESSVASRRRISIRSKRKSTERVEHTEDVEKSKEKYESRIHILEDKMQEWNELLDDDLWDSFRTEFAEWIDENFKLASIIIQKKLKTFLQSRNVWVMKSSKLIIAKSFAQIIEKDIFISWTEEEIRSSLKSETFISHVIIHLLKTNFERNSKDYFWQAFQSESKHSESSHSTESRIQSTKSRMQFTESYLRTTQKSSFRERSTQFITREMQQSFIRLFHQSSIKHSLRESSIARNFLRQSSSSSSRSEVQEISENLYSDSSSSFSSKHLYIRHQEKKSMSKQSFQSRFSKFYQSSELSEQFYRRSTEYSSLVSSSSSILSQSLIPKSFVSSSLFSSVNQSIKTSGTDYDRELANLAKLYSDETKYSEEKNNFSFKLIMFNDMCDRVDISSEIKLKHFSLCLRN
jgi:hypothetical protein